ncbi:MAG: restriction endonuclease subunit S, partial [Mobilibacterium timonense]|uniref:restriction endonuclease subunit S n=1 Tax=Mobilibacterium timonense TaxID=1871012 RepID=UPI002353CFD6
MRTEYRLDELFDLQMGKTPARNNTEYWDSEDHKWISIADLSKCGKYIVDTKEYLSEKAVQESGISLIPENTVIMSFKLSIGKTAITPEPMYSNEAIMSFRDKHVTEILPDYLYYMFSGKNWEAGTNKAVMGKTLNKATLSGTRIKVHDVEEQRAIVAVLDKVKVVLDAREEELEKLDDLIKARFVELFGDPRSNPFGYGKKPLGSTCKVITGNTPSRKVPEYYGEYIEWIKTDNIVSG